MYTTRVPKIKYCTVIDAYNIIYIQMYPKCTKMLDKEPSQSCIFNDKMHECIQPLVLWAAIGDTIIISNILLADNLVSPMAFFIEVAKRDSFSQHWLLNLTVPLGSIVIGMPKCNGVGSHGSENIRLFFQDQEYQNFGNCLFSILYTEKLG